MKIPKTGISHIATRLSQLKNIPRKRLGVFAACLIAAVVLVFVLASKQTSKQAQGSVCSKETVEQAVSVIHPSRVADLKVLASKIMKNKNYEQDVDCLYIVLNYHINNADAGKARATLAKFEKVYNSDKGISPFFNAPTFNINDLRNNIAFLEKQTAEYEKNGRALNGF